MIRAFLFVFLAFAGTARAQLQSHDSIGLTHVTWNERVKLFQNTVIDNGSASYLGNTILIDRTWLAGRYGFGAGASAGVGYTSSGDFNGTTSFNETGKRSFTLFGLTPRVFYRLTGQVQIGASAPVIYRSVNWSSTDSSITVQTRRDLGMSFGLDLRALLSPNWEISQDLALLSSEAETFWSIGVHYRFN